MLNTFVKPTPCIKTMTKLAKINRWMNLNGIGILKHIPIVNQYFPARGLCDITNIEYLSDLSDVKKKIENSAFFIGPNHPEFYTDWMLDKEISSHIAPEMAGWATHSIVNGLGKKMQRFWLKNNLIAQIPGAGNAAKEYSIEYALTGKGVLLHPEGKVNWHADYIHQLYAGIIDMSHQVLLRSHYQKEVYVVPVLWKLMFNSSVDAKIKKEIQYIAKQHAITINTQLSAEKQLADLIRTLFILQMQKTDVICANYQTFSLQEFSIKLRYSLLRDVAQYFSYHENIVDKESFNSAYKFLHKKIKELNKAMLINSDQRANQVIKNFKILEKINEFDFEPYLSNQSLTQEHLAEIVQKLRIQFCHKKWIDKIHKFIPMPLSDRTAYVKIAPLLKINDHFSAEMTEESITKKKIELLQYLRDCMQSTLDNVNSKLMSKNTYYNIFRQ